MIVVIVKIVKMEIAVSNIFDHDDDKEGDYYEDCAKYGDDG